MITSNRDESNWRPRSLAPAIQEFSSGKILFPCDPHAGGTWFAAHENGHVLIFLNGAFQKHEPKPPYRKSRGIVLLELADQDEPFDAFLEFDLERIEPFTGILWQENELLEFRWNGEKKYYRKLDPGQQYIWSSVTLYDTVTMNKRKSWFQEWIIKNAEPGLEEVMNFHLKSGDGDAKNDLLMNREDKISTMSITSTVITQDLISMNHLDIQTEKLSTQNLTIHKVITIK